MLLLAVSCAQGRLVSKGVRVQRVSILPCSHIRPTCCRETTAVRTEPPKHTQRASKVTASSGFYAAFLLAVCPRARCQNRLQQNPTRQEKAMAELMGQLIHINDITRNLHHHSVVGFIGTLKGVRGGGWGTILPLSRPD